MLRTGSRCRERRWCRTRTATQLRLFLTLCLTALLASPASRGSASPQPQAVLDATVAPWLRGLVSPSKAALLASTGLQHEDAGEPLAAMTLAFPAWLAQTGGLLDAARDGSPETGPDDDAGSGSRNTHIHTADPTSPAGDPPRPRPRPSPGPAADRGWTPPQQLPLLAAGPELLQLGDFLRRGDANALREDLESLENVRSAQRLEDAVTEILRGITAAHAAGVAAGGSAEAAGAADVVSGIRSHLFSELERLAALLPVSVAAAEPSPGTGDTAPPPGSGTLGSDAAAGATADTASGGGGKGSAGPEVRHEEPVGALTEALGRSLEDGLAAWLGHAASHPPRAPVRAPVRDGGGSGGSSGRVGQPEAQEAVREREGDGPGGNRLRRRLQQQAGNNGRNGEGDGGGNDGGGSAGGAGGSGDGGGGGSGGAGGGGAQDGSATWFEDVGIQAFDWRDERPVRDAVAGAALNRPGKGRRARRARGTERLLQLFHIAQRDLLEGNVPFTGGRVQRWCVNQPYVFMPRVPDALPEEYVGPAFFITHTTGNCVVRPDITAPGDNTWAQLYRRLACLGPSLQYLLLPAVHNGRGDQPESFSCTQCAPVMRLGHALDVTFYPMEPRTIQFPDKRAFLRALHYNATLMRWTAAGGRRAASWLLRNLHSHLRDVGRSTAAAAAILHHPAFDPGPFTLAVEELVATVTGAGPFRVNHGKVAAAAAVLDALRPGGVGGAAARPMASELLKGALRPGSGRRRRRRQQRRKLRTELTQEMEDVAAVAAATAPLAAWRLPGMEVADGSGVADDLAEAVRAHARQQQRELERLLGLLP